MKQVWSRLAGTKIKFAALGLTAVFMSAGIAAGADPVPAKWTTDAQSVAADGQTNSPDINAPARKVRMGVFQLGQYQRLSYDKDGNLKLEGYNADYLASLTRFMHWDIEYVNCNNWNMCTGQLQQGKIDILSPAQFTKNMAPLYEYSALALGTESAAIYTRADSTIEYEDFAAMNGLTYGVAEKSTFTRHFLSNYIKKNNLNPTIKYYRNTTELQSAFDNGEVDAIVTNIMFAAPNKKLLGWFDVLPVYYIMNKGNTELKEEIDIAMRELSLREPALIANLTQRHFPILRASAFSAEERRFVASVPVLNVAYRVNQKPLSYTSENGKFAGITHDILTRVAAGSGLTFRYVPLPVDAELTLEDLAARGIDIISNAEYESVRDSKSKMMLTTPYIEVDRVFVTGQDDLMQSGVKHRRVGVVISSKIHMRRLHKLYPHYDFLPMNTIEETFEALKSGKVDAVMTYRYVADNVMDNPRYANYTVIPVQTAGNHLSLGIVDYSATGEKKYLSNRLLTSVLDKSIRQVTTDTVDRIVVQNLSRSRYRAQFIDFARAYTWQILAFVTLLIALMFLVIFISVMRQKHAGSLVKLNRKLEEAVRKANAANAAKSSFLAQISHEIRTPMNAIVGLTAVAQTELDKPDAVADYLRKIDGSSQQLLSLINAVLDMAAIEGNKLKIDSAPFNIKTLLNAMLSMFYEQAQQKDVLFSVHLENLSQEALIGDELRIKQVLMNLLSNAIKFTPPEGTVVLKITQSSHSFDKTMIRFSVSDTGCGMDENMAKRLFSPFEQESSSTARKYGGSGLGMSITKSLVEMMGGTISFKSEVDKGTTFDVDIPFKVSKETVASPTFDFSKIRVLVVDDDPEERHYCTMLLTRMGVRNVTVENGDQALTEIGNAEEAKDPFRMCIIDLRMPGMDGIECTRKIREIFCNFSIVVIVSAFSLDTLKEEGRKAGVNYFIAKPLFQSTIFNALAQISGAAEPIEPKKQMTHYDFSGKRVMIAEDVALNMEVIIKLLKLVGIKTICAEDGVQAVSLFEQSKPGYYDCILMDINMPNMDGYEATRRIRALNRTDAATVPIYAMTANAFVADVSNAMEAGMNGHMSKPIDTEELYKLLARVFDADAKSGEVLPLAQELE